MDRRTTGRAYKGYQAYRKYGNKKVTIDGIQFDSKHEAQRWAELRLMERAGEICELERQVSFCLIPTQRDEITGKVIEREAKYIADFVYRDKKTYKLVVEDAKGMKTDVYKLKKKLMLYRHGIQIREV